MAMLNQFSGPTRRQLIARGGLVTGALFVPRWTDWIASASTLQPAAAADPLTAMRNQMGAAPIERVALGDTLVMLSGPGGNVVVLNGADGKVVVDTFVLPAWGNLKKTLDAIGTTPIATLIDTHWHFDHADNNQNFRKAGARILAHENTKQRLSETHDLLGIHFTPAPADALPTETFKDTHTLNANGEQLMMGHFAAAHTDTDIWVRYVKANVLHMGDVYFSGMYPFFDIGTGGNINGMIAGAEAGLKIADARTKIVPGHGPLADRAALAKSRDMLVMVRDRIQKLKASGQTVQQVVAAKPTADLDAVWGKGFMQPNDFVGLVYSTL